MIITRTICLDASEVEEAIISYLLGKKHLKIDKDAIFHVRTYNGEYSDDSIDVYAKISTSQQQQPEAKTVPASRILE